MEPYEHLSQALDVVDAAMSKPSLLEQASLNDVWAECLRMWAWIVEQVKAGNIGYLKAVWLEDNGYGECDISNDCFFCQYSILPGDTCTHCPGKLVDRNWHCENPAYRWYDHPIEFNAEIKRLDAIRRTKHV